MDPAVQAALSRAPSRARARASAGDETAVWRRVVGSGQPRGGLHGLSDSHRDSHGGGTWWLVVHHVDECGSDDRSEGPPTRPPGRNRSTTPSACITRTHGMPRVTVPSPRTPQTRIGSRTTRSTGPSRPARGRRPQATDAHRPPRLSRRLAGGGRGFAVVRTYDRSGGAP
jgi:hypothetical protein